MQNCFGTSRFLALHMLIDYLSIIVIFLRFQDGGLQLVQLSPQIVGLHLAEPPLLTPTAPGEIPETEPAEKFGTVIDPLWGL